ncbi:MAG: transporter [Nitrospirota bacterium]
MMKSRFLFQGLIIIFSVFAAFVCAGSAFAAHPLITDDTGTQGKNRFQLEVNGEYANDNGDSLAEISASFSAGLTEKIDFVLGLPYQFLRVKDEAGERITEDGISDISIEMKWRFYEKDGLCLALKPGLTLDTGDDERGLGDGEASYSLFLITTKEIEPLAFHFNLGYIKNREELRDIWHYSLAGEYEAFKDLKVVWDIGGETNPDRETNTHPVFLLGGIIYSIKENLDVDFGLKTGLNRAEADYTIMAGTAIRF